MALSILGFSVPTFWFGLMLIMVFAVQCGCMPAGGRGATMSLLGVDFSFLTGDGLAIWCYRRSTSRFSNSH